MEDSSGIASELVGARALWIKDSNGSDHPPREEDLKTLVDESARKCLPGLALKGLKLNRSVNGNHEARIFRHDVEMIIEELICNAVEASDVGQELSIRIDERNGLHGERTIEVRVIDEGERITKAEREAIAANRPLPVGPQGPRWEPLTRAARRRNQRRLDRRQAGPDRARQYRDPSHPGCAMPSVLIIDDNSRDHERYRSFLGAEFDLRICSSAAEALRSIEPGSPHPNIAVILWELPGNPNGSGLLTHLHGTFPDMPILVVSGLLDLARAARARAMGAVDFLLKPLDRDRLLTATRSASGARPDPPLLPELKTRLVGESRAFWDSLDALARVIPEHGEMILLVGEKTAPARSCWRGPCTTWACRRKADWSRSTLPPFPRP